MTYRDTLLDGVPIADTLVINCHAHIDRTWNLPRDSMDAESMVRVMDALGIDVACISSARALTGDVRGGNDRMLDAIRRWPRRFVGAVAVSPQYPGEVLSELDRVLAFDGVGMIKLHPEGHGHPIDGPGYEAVWPFAAERRLPVIIHTWFEGRGLDHPAQAAAVAERFPAIPIILAHSGGTPAGLEFCAALARRLPNIYLDTGTSPSYRLAIETLVGGGVERVLFGSDASYLADPPQLGKVAGASIAEADKRAILGGNMARLLRATGRILPALQGRTSPSFETPQDRPVPLSTGVERGDVGAGMGG